METQNPLHPMPPLHPQNPQKTTYRYNFSDEIINLLNEYSRLHMYSDRITFKENWEKWCESHEEELTIEYSRLKNLGYQNDINNKMFKATRYYFKKKNTPNSNENTSQPEPQPELTKRQYITIDPNLIAEMDTYIKNNYKETSKPSTSYDEFSITYTKQLDNERIRLKNLNTLSLNTPEKYTYKLKKTYKNRYYLYTDKL